MYQKHTTISLACLVLCLFWSSSILAQSFTVKGKVSDESGLGLPGAAIQVKGTAKGIITDLDGNYTLRVPSKNSTLVFSYMSMVTQEIALKGRKRLNVTLREQSLNLNEVVVIGYAAVKKKEVTGAVTQVKAEDLSKIVSNDMSSALQGQVSGVSVTANSGAPGAESTILIRGVTSVDGSNTPLYVVDGIPQEGDPHLNANEISTIDVLKDAASCAIYGTRGAAGVILVTTKQGKAGKMKIRLNSTYGIQHITSNIFLMNNLEQTYFDLVYNRNQGNLYDDAVNNIGLYKSDKYFYNNTNLIDNVFVDNAKVQNHSLTLSGGNQEMTYSVTAGYYQKEGIIINSDYNRFNSRSNIVYKKNNVYVRVGMNLSIEDTKKASGGILTQSLKYFPTQNPLSLDETFETSGGVEQSNISYVLQSFTEENNLAMAKAGVNGEFRLDLYKGLQLSSHMGYTAQNGHRKIFRPNMKIVDFDGNDLTRPNNSYVKRESINRKSISLDMGLQYQLDLNKNHFTLFAATTYERYDSEGFLTGRYWVQDNNIKVLDSAAIDPFSENSFNYTNTLIGTIGRIQYNWDSRYLFNMSIRRDGSSKFAEGNHWGVFPSLSAAWNISDEAFFSPIKSVVNDMKIRASYGTTGNQSFAPYSYSAAITSGYDYSFGQDNQSTLGLGASQDKYANALVQWETSKQLNFGVDLSLFNNRLTFAAEYYKTQKEDMLFPLTLPGSVGTTDKVILNIGDMENSGIELAMGYRSQIGHLRYKINTTFSTNKNEITSINGTKLPVYTNDNGLISAAVNQSRVTMLAEGHEAGAFYLWRTDGIADTDVKLAEYQKINPLARMGDVVYIDQNGDGQMSDLDRVYSGSGLPDYEIGFNYQLNYNQWDLYMNWYSALGQEIMNGAKATAFAYGRAKDLVYAWSESNPNTSIPAYRGDIKKHENYIGYSDLWLEDGSYIRLKNITLGYTVPQKVTEKLHLQKLRFYMSAQNALTITKYSGYDPEIGGSIISRGLDKGNYPSAAVYMLGMNLNF